jgi:hypothetical protein
MVKSQYICNPLKKKWGMLFEKLQLLNPEREVKKALARKGKKLHVCSPQARKERGVRRAEKGERKNKK